MLRNVKTLARSWDPLYAIGQAVDQESTPCLAEARGAWAMKNLAGKLEPKRNAVAQANVILEFLRDAPTTDANRVAIRKLETEIEELLRLHEGAQERYEAAKKAISAPDEREACAANRRSKRGRGLGVELAGGEFILEGAGSVWVSRLPRRGAPRGRSTLALRPGGLRWVQRRAGVHCPPWHCLSRLAKMHPTRRAAASRRC